MILQNPLPPLRYVTGPLHPEVEETVTYVMKLVKDMLHSHVDREKEQKTEWWPARRTTKEAGANDDEAFCQGVCRSATSEGEPSMGALAW